MAWGEELTTVALERGPALVGYAYLLTGDLDSARDLVQEALVRTYGRPRTASDLAWVEAYVRRVILNIYLDAYRRDRAWGRVRHLFVVPEAGPPGTPTLPPAPPTRWTCRPPCRPCRRESGPASCCASTTT